MAQGREVYRSFIADSRRWDDVRHRPGDIVISTPSKSGTTWMQMLVALLVLDGPDLPAPLSDLSPWVEKTLAPADATMAHLEAQAHRRFMKTHVPLDGLPLDDRVTYVVVGRDPRDVWMSMQHHERNIDVDRVMRLRDQAQGNHDLGELDQVDWPEDPAERFRFQLSLDRRRSPTAVHLAHVLHHLRTAWDRRHDDNVVLFHYADLQADLPAEVQRLGRVLGLPVDHGRAEQLAAEASLDAMRRRADHTAPETSLGALRDVTEFFRSGATGEWRDLCRDGDLEHYHARVAELSGGDADFVAWVHGGWRAVRSPAR